MKDPILEAHRQKQAAARALVEDATKRLVDEGKLIEAGWVSLKMLTIPPDAPEVQITEMRNAFFAGAQHLFGSIMTMLDPGGPEPTEADLRRLDQISTELQRFIDAYVQRHRPAGTA